MQKKIYVSGMDDDALAAKVDAAVKSVAGVVSCVSSAAKCQVCVDFEGDIESAIDAAISSTGVTVLG